MKMKIKTLIPIIATGIVCVLMNYWRNGFVPNERNLDLLFFICTLGLILSICLGSIFSKERTHANAIEKNLLDHIEADLLQHVAELGEIENKEWSIDDTRTTHSGEYKEKI